MNMSLELQLRLDTKFYFSDELDGMAKSVAESNGRIYSWKTTGNKNWLERYVSIVDTLGYVVLPVGLPYIIEMLDDE